MNLAANDLLTLAAKAARIDTGKPWAPLEDDGDALRLADALEMDILHRVVGGTRVEILLPGGPLTQEFYVGTSLRLVATRLAIVRAAAERGRRMP